MIYKERNFPLVVLLTVVLLCSLIIISPTVRAEDTPLEAVPMEDTKAITNDVTQHDFNITSGGTYLFSGNNPDATITVDDVGENQNVTIKLEDAEIDCIKIKSGRTYLETLDSNISSVNTINIINGASLNIIDDEFLLDSATVDNGGILNLQGSEISLHEIINRDRIFIGDKVEDNPKVTLQTFVNIDGQVTSYGTLSVIDSGSNRKGGRLINKGMIKLVGSYNNSGELVNESGAKFKNEGILINTDTFDNKGTFHNDGKFDNSEGAFNDKGSTTNDGIWVNLAKSGQVKNDLSKYSYLIKDNYTYTFIGGDTRNHSIQIEKDALPTVDLTDVTRMGEIVVEDNADVRITTANSGTTINGNKGEPGVILGENAVFNHLGGTLTINGGGDAEIRNQQAGSIPVYDIAGWNNSGKMQKCKVVVKKATLNALVCTGEEKSVLYGKRTLDGTLDLSLHVTKGAELTLSPKGVYMVGADGGAVDGTIQNHGTIEVYDGTLSVSKFGKLFNHGIIRNGFCNCVQEADSISESLLVEGSLTNEVDAVIRNDGSNITIRPNGSITNQGIIYTEDGTIEQKKEHGSQGVDLIPNLGGRVYYYNLESDKYTLDLGIIGLMNLTNTSIGGHQYSASEIFPKHQISKNFNVVIPKENYTLEYEVRSVSTTETGDYESLLTIVATGQNHAYGVLSKEIEVPMAIEPIQPEQSLVLAPNMPYMIGKNSGNRSGWSISGIENDNVAIKDASVYSPDTPFYVVKHCKLTFTEVAE